MRSVTTILMLLLLCLMLHAAEDQSSKTPKWHESLKEFEWLVGEWTHATEYVTGDARDGLVLHPLSISPSDDGRTLTMTYQYAFVNKSGLGPHTFSCREVLAYLADQEGITTGNVGQG